MQSYATLVETSHAHVKSREEQRQAFQFFIPRAPAERQLPRFTFPQMPMWKAEFGKNLPMCGTIYRCDNGVGFFGVGFPGFVCPFVSRCIRIGTDR
jgi:hypothetical protein